MAFPGFCNVLIKTDKVVTIANVVLLLIPALKRKGKNINTL